MEFDERVEQSVTIGYILYFKFILRTFATEFWNFLLIKFMK